MLIDELVAEVRSVTGSASAISNQDGDKADASPSRTNRRQPAELLSSSFRISYRRVCLNGRSVKRI